MAKRHRGIEEIFPDDVYVMEIEYENDINAVLSYIRVRFLSFLAKSEIKKYSDCINELITEIRELHKLNEISLYFHCSEDSEIFSSELLDDTDT